jgi:hypothetical protein
VKELERTGEDNADASQRHKIARFYELAGMSNEAARWYLQAAIHAERSETFGAPVFFVRRALLLSSDNPEVRREAMRLFAKYGVG